MKKHLILAFSVALVPCLGLSAINSNEPQDQLITSTEKILQLEKTELEKASANLTIEQKMALKSIASNKDSEIPLRWKALVLASRLLGSEMREQVLLASKSSDWFMRSASLSAASEISNSESADLARKLIKDKALVVRSAAVDILATTGEESDRNLLWDTMGDPTNSRKGQSLWIRSQTLKHLAKRPLKKEIGQFIGILQEDDAELQSIAIHALEKAADFQFGSSQDTIDNHRQRWLNWWETNGKVKSF